MRAYQDVWLAAFFSVLRFGQCARVQDRLVARAIVPTAFEKIGINPISGLVPITQW